MMQGLSRWGTLGIVCAGALALATPGLTQQLFQRAPAPQFTAEQVQRGQSTYVQQGCASCHGATLDGAVAPALKGESFRREWGDKAPSTLLSYVQLRMPPVAPGSMSVSTVADLGAYLFQANGYAAGDKPLTYEVQSGPRAVNRGVPNEDAAYKAVVQARNEQLKRLRPVSEEMLRAPPPGDWLMARRNYAALGHSPLQQIDKSNVSRLQVAWSWSLAVSANEITPLVHDGVLFIKSGNTVQAFDGASGSLLWSYARPSPDKPAPFGDIVRSLAVYQDKLFVPAGSHMVALDIHDGHPIWDRQVLDPATSQRMAGGPIVAHGKVVIGVNGCDTGGGCFILGLDAQTGQESWRFNTIARPGQPGGDSWNGAAVEERFGAGVWISGSYDPDLNLVYFGVAQTYDTARLLLPQKRRGESADALYTDSTLALNPDTGKLAWHYQHFNRDVWDFDWAYERMLVTLPVQGKPTKLVVTGGKIAIFDALDRTNGQYVFSHDLGLQTLVKSIDPKTGRKIINPEFEPTAEKTNLICPHDGGGRNWPATSYDPETHILYVPLVETCERFTWRPVDAAASARGASDLDAVVVPRPGNDGNFGRLEAIDLETGKVLWMRRQRAPEATSVLTTAGGLVFDGARDRRFIASDARTGRMLWQARLNAVPNSSPITYTANGRQYVAVVAGVGGPLEATWPTLTPEIDNPVGGGTTLWVFSLPGGDAR